MTPGVRAAARALGARVLVEYVELDGEHHTLTLADGRLELHDLGEVDVSTDLEWLRFALRRLARGGLDGAARTTTLANARAAADALDRQLIAPLRDAIGDVATRDRPDRTAARRSMGRAPVAARPADLGRALAVDVARSRHAHRSPAIARQRSSPARTCATHAPRSRRSKASCPARRS